MGLLIRCSEYSCQPRIIRPLTLLICQLDFIVQQNTRCDKFHFCDCEKATRTIAFGINITIKKVLMGRLTHQACRPTPNVINSELRAVVCHFRGSFPTKRNPWNSRGSVWQRYDTIGDLYQSWQNNKKEGYEILPRPDSSRDQKLLSCCPWE